MAIIEQLWKGAWASVHLSLPSKPKRKLFYWMLGAFRSVLSENPKTWASLNATYQMNTEGSGNQKRKQY